MIVIAGERWGTAAEIAAHLGTTTATIRRWAERDHLTAVRGTDQHGRPQVHYPLGQALLIDRAKRHARRGRPRTT